MADLVPVFDLPKVVDGVEFGKGVIYKLPSSDGKEYLNLVGVRKEVSFFDRLEYATFFSVCHDLTAHINSRDFSFFRSKMPVSSLRVMGDVFLPMVENWKTTSIWYDEEKDGRSYLMETWLRDCADILRGFGCVDVEDIFRGKMTWGKGSRAYEIFGRGYGKVF